eukprot:Em0002g786a
MMNGKLRFVMKRRKSIAIKKIGRFEGGTLARCIIVEGIPGVGKSTLAWQLGRRWGKKEILQHFQLVIVLRLRDERVQKAHTISELLYHPNKVIRESVVEWMASTLGEDVLLILDGYDELSSELQIGDQSIFACIIKGEELPKLTVLVTSRPSANRNLDQLCRIRAKCQYIEVVGFGKKEIREYVELAFKSNFQLKDGFNLYIKQRPHIRSMMYVPINCAIVVELFREHKGKPPQTLTEVYTTLTNTLLQRHEKKTKEKTSVGMPNTECHELLKKHYSDLVGTIQDPAGLAGSLYSKGMITRSVRDEIQQRGDLITKRKNEVLINAVEAQVTTDPSMFQVFMEVLKEEPSLSTIAKGMSVSTVTSSKMTCFEGLSSTTLSQLQSVARLAYQGTLNDQLIFHDVQDNIESLGLLQKVPQVFSTSSSKASYNFIHKTLQEFLTAWYVSSLPTSEQRVFVKDSLTKPNMAMTVRFMAGLTKFQTSSENMDALSDIVISLETTDEERFLENLHWMFETQNPTIIQRLMGYKEQTFKCSNTILNPFDLHVLGYCIANSCTLWSVNLLECYLTNECMRMLFLVEEGKAFDHITSFDLSGNTITASMASLLVMMLKENNTLKELDLARCELEPEGLEEVIKGVQVHTMLETLVLSYNTIDNKRASCLGMMLKENNTLKKLDLEGCRLQPEGLEEVIKGVQVNTMLETLDLSYNTIDNKSASCLAHALKRNTTLSELRLIGCGLRDEAICELCGGLKWCKLKKLDCHWNFGPAFSVSSAFFPLRSIAIFATEKILEHFANKITLNIQRSFHPSSFLETLQHLDSTRVENAQAQAKDVRVELCVYRHPLEYSLNGFVHMNTYEYGHLIVPQELWEDVLVVEDPQLGILLRKGFMDTFPQEYSQLRVFTHENILPLLAVITFANTIQLQQRAPPLWIVSARVASKRGGVTMMSRQLACLVPNPSLAHQLAGRCDISGISLCSTVFHVHQEPDSAGLQMIHLSSICVQRNILEGGSLLHCVAANGGIKVLSLLMESIAMEMNQQDNIALDRASDKGVIVIVQELLKFIPNVNPKVKIY